MNGNGHGNGKTNDLVESPDIFVSPSKGNLPFAQVAAEVIDFISSDASSSYTVGVGTDSEQEHGANTAEFVSVVVVHRVGKHGRYFWKRSRGVKAFDRHDRILKEAFSSLELAQRLVVELRRELDESKYNFEIHLDVGQNGPTKSMIQEVVGIVTGNGFTAKIKPESYAANKVADRHVNPHTKRESDALGIKDANSRYGVGTNPGNRVQVV